MTTTPNMVENLQRQLGRHVRRLRLGRNMSVEAVAQATDLAEKSVRNLESGRGSTTETLFKVLSAVDAARLLKHLAPAEVLAETGVAPLRQRARRLPGLTSATA
jgi:transcriptional regulator with XRE-family HTH domain